MYKNTKYDKGTIDSRNNTIYDRPESYHICNLNLNHWDLGKVKAIITKIKEKYVL